MANAKSDLIAFVRDGLGLAPSVTVDLSPLGVRGSDRVYYRVHWGTANSAILVDYDLRRVENGYFADIAAFLMSIDVSVPRVISHDSVKCLILMEDLGGVDLWSLRTEPWEKRRALYQDTLVVVHRLHSFSISNFPTRGVRLMEPFSSSLYRWERDYFLEHFVEGVCGLDLGSSLGEELERELAGLAERLLSSPACLLHRDLQSQNVMIYQGSPVLIDFQGMRFGSAFYDLGSLLFDPYVEFLPAERNELLRYCYGLMESTAPLSVFEGLFHEASAQRLMQALGAYGLLGVKRGLKAYVAHIPAGLRNLVVAAGKAGSLPVLEGLCSMCAKSLQDRFEVSSPR